MSLSLSLSRLVFGPRKPSRYSDLLRGARPGDRIPVGARSFAPVQTGSGSTQPLVQWETSFFPGYKAAGRGIYHAPKSIAEVRKEYSYTHNLPLGLCGPF